MRRDCCGGIHTDRDIDGELFELCAECQAELTAFTFEQAGEAGGLELSLKRLR